MDLYESVRSNKRLPVVSLLGLRFVSLIVTHPSGIQYWNQVGGKATSHRLHEGVLVPFVWTEPSVQLQEWLTAVLRVLFRERGAPNSGPLTVEVADAIDAIFTDRGETEVGRMLQRTAWLHVDRERLEESEEAWVHVVIEDECPIVSADMPRAAILTWPNSDWMTS